MTTNDYKLVFGDNSFDLNKYLAINSLNEMGGHTGAIGAIGSDASNSLSLTDFLNLLIANVANNSEKCDVWSDILLDLIDNNLVNDLMWGQVLSIGIAKSQSHSLENRVLSCKMLTKLCRQLNEEVFLRKVLEPVICLCNDLQPSVRAHMSKQLSLLSQNLSLETIEDRIIPLLSQLTIDRELVVRVAGIESMIELIPKLEEQFTKEAILPQMFVFFGSALQSNNKSLGLIFMNFGKLCQTLPIDVISNEKWFLDYYFNVFLICNDLQLKAKNISLNERDIHCRNLLALFFPILLRIYGPNESLNSVLNFLCCDLDITVVRTIASVFNQINHYLKNGFKIYPQISKILSQRNIILAKELMPFLSNLLIDAIKSAPNDDKKLLFEDISKTLIICEETINLNLDWRLHINIFNVFTQVMVLLPLDLLKTYFIPLIIHRILKSRPIPVRIESCRCLLCLFRDFPLLEDDFNIFEWFVKNLCFGKSCSQRMLFLNVCQLVYEIFNMKTIIKYFLEPMLSLCADKVPNIRLNVCNKFKLFKNLFEIPEICAKKETIKTIFKQMLAKETDRDVIQSIHQMIEEFNWSSDFTHFGDPLIENLIQDFIELKFETDIEVNNNSVETKELNSMKNDSIKVKSCLPQLIHSQDNSQDSSRLTSKCVSTTPLSDSLASIPSRIPKPITKNSK